MQGKCVASGDRKGGLDYKGRGLFSLNLLHFSVPPGPTPFNLGERTQNHILTSPNLPPCCLLPWSVLWFPPTHTPSSSSTQGHGWGSRCRPARLGSGAVRTQSSPLPFHPFLLTQAPTPIYVVIHLVHPHPLSPPPPPPPLPRLSCVAYMPDTRMSPLPTTSSSPNPCGTRKRMPVLCPCWA